MNTDRLPFIFCVNVFILVKDLASVERNTHSCLLPEGERIQSCASRYPQTEKKNITLLEKLCGLSPNQEKVTRSLLIAFSVFT